MSTTDDAIIEKAFEHVAEQEPMSSITRADIQQWLDLLRPMIAEQKLILHLAVIELDEDMDPMLFVARTLDDLHAQLRTAIETLVLDDVVPEHWPEVWAYVNEHEKDGSAWGDWHPGLHEIDGTPWVTITEREV